MSSPFSIDPAVVQQLTANLDNIGTSLAKDHAAAAGPTTGVAAAAADEVSTAVASLFGQHASEYQTLAAKAAAFHAQFTRNLEANAASFVNTEAQNAAAITDVGSAPFSPWLAIFGRAAFGNGVNGANGVVGINGGAGGAGQDGGFIIGNGGNGGAGANPGHSWRF